MSGSNILFIITGSIAAYKACEVISTLAQSGHRVRAVMTPEATRFVGVATVEGLTRHRVAVELFEPGAALEHIELTRWADVVVVCPASAHTINRFSIGLADDLVGALFLAHDFRKPWLLVPAMNPAMWQHPATAAAVRRLQEWGVQFSSPGDGRTACGETGTGRMAEPDEIVRFIEHAGRGPNPRLRILITSGGTAERIDGVRVISNLSTGSTGARLARDFAHGGHDVLLLRARSAEHVPGLTEREYISFSDLDAALGELLGGGNFDAIIHAAAVGDFAVESVEIEGEVRAAGVGKISSSAAPVLRLRKLPKLVNGLRARSRHAGIRVIAFKLTEGAEPAAARAAVQALLADSGADLVVQNDFASRVDANLFPSEVFDREGGSIATCQTRAELSDALQRWLADEFPWPRADATGGAAAIDNPDLAPAGPGV